MFYGGFIFLIYFLFLYTNLSFFFPAFATIVNLFLSYNFKKNPQTCSEFVTLKTTFVLSDHVHIPTLKVKSCVDLHLSTSYCLYQITGFKRCGAYKNIVTGSNQDRELNYISLKSEPCHHCNLGAELQLFKNVHKLFTTLQNYILVNILCQLRYPALSG